MTAWPPINASSGAWRIGSAIRRGKLRNQYFAFVENSLINLPAPRPAASSAISDK
jgi:hypothetical protein